VGRVIARPFTGRPGAFTRTSGRRDFSCEPPAPTLLDNAKAAGQPVVGIGKVDDLFARRGFTATRHSVNNDECVSLLLDSIARVPAGLLLCNLVQFDMDWGHRNDPAGFALGLADFDSRLPALLDALRPGDALFITADHGCDPTTPSTDHSREYVPLLVCGPALRRNIDLGTRSTFADLGRTAAEWLGVSPPPHGTSFLKEVIA
jgi:phosphopentomutase